nr:MAG TPA: hypothetical protein [Caudoviricetes sp.]
MTQYEYDLDAMEKEIKKNKIRWAVFVAAIILFVALVVYWGIDSVKDYKDLINNSPTNSWIEEDLEDDLLTLDVRVIVAWQEPYDIYTALVWANNSLWKVVYRAYVNYTQWTMLDVTFVGYMSEEEVNKIL